MIEGTSAEADVLDAQQAASEAQNFSMVAKNAAEKAAGEISEITKEAVGLAKLAAIEAVEAAGEARAAAATVSTVEAAEESIELSFTAKTSAARSNAEIS